MTRSRSHVIGEKAVGIVCDESPETWVCEAQVKDYGIDLKIEIFNENPSDNSLQTNTGVQVAGQVKGKEKDLRKIAKGKFVTAKVSIGNLLDHLKRRYPVYLFRVDNSERKVYWLFLQKHLLELKDQSWRERELDKELTIRIPVENDDLSKLDGVITDHVKFIEDLFPGSPAASLAKYKKKIGEIDSRFEVEIQTRGNVTVSLLSTNEPVDLKVSFSNEDDPDSLEERLSSFTKTGRLTKFSCEEISIKGSPIFDDWTSGVVVIGAQKQRDFSIELEFKDRKDKTLDTLRFPKTVRITGSDQTSIKTQEGCPLVVEVLIDVKDYKMNCNMNVNLQAWHEQELRDLSFFQLTKRFLEASQIASRLEVRLVHEEGIDATSGSDYVNMFEPTYSYFNAIKMCKEIAEKFDLPSILDIDKVPVDSIELVHWVVFDGKEKSTSTILENGQTLHAPAGELDALLAHSQMSIRQVYPEFTIRLFGEEVGIGQIDILYNNVKPVSLADTHQLPEELLGRVPIGFECTEATTSKLITLESPCQNGSPNGKVS